LGGRSTLLGGTGVALGRDGASPFLNPAAMGRIADHRLAFSVHFYRYSTTHVDSLIHAPEGFNAQAHDYDANSFSTLPASFCAFATLSGLIPEEAQGLWQTVRGQSGRTKLGICGATIEREQFGFDALSSQFNSGSSHANVAYNVVHNWQRQSLGPSLSYQLSERITVGATFQIVSTTANQNWDLAAVVDKTDGHVYAHHLRGSAIDGVTTLGATWSGRPLSFGLTVRLPSINVTNSAQFTEYVSSQNSPPRLLTGRGSFEAPILPTLSVGVGAEFERSLVEFDVSTTFASSSGLRTSLKLEDNGSYWKSVVSHDSIRPAVAFRVGAERFISPSLSVLTGARYEPTSIRNGFSQPSYRLGPMSRDLVAMSVGLGSYGRGTELILGAELAHSFGHTPIVSALDGDASYSETSYKNTSLLLVVSGSVGFSAVRQTWKSFRQLTPPKGSN
jgi:hypothetical protein